MTDPLVTPDFFAPILNRDNPGFSPYLTYLQDCDRMRLAMTAMARARDAGKLRTLSFPDDRAFEEGRAWNRIASGGGTQRDIFPATCLLLEAVDSIVGDCFDSFPRENGSRDLADTTGLRQALVETSEKIEAWLADPKQHPHLDPLQLPRGTSFMDRSDARLGSQYLVQMNGWEDMQVLEKELGTDWHVAGTEWEEPEPDYDPAELFLQEAARVWPESDGFYRVEMEGQEVGAFCLDGGRQPS